MQGPRFVLGYGWWKWREKTVTELEKVSGSMWPLNRREGQGGQEVCGSLKCVLSLVGMSSQVKTLGH